MSTTTKLMPDQPENFRQDLPRSRVVAPKISLGRRLRRWLVPERPREAIGNFLVVALLTVMIWVWAFNEQVTSDRVDQRIELQSENPDRFVRLVDSHQNTITFRIRGQKSVVDQFKAMSMRGQGNRLNLTVPSNLEPGQRSLPVNDLLRGANQFSEKGLTVLETFPAQIEVMIDDMVTRAVEIKAPTTLTGYRSVIFTPSTVEARGPRSSIERITSAVADFSSFDALKRPPTPGQDVTLESVPLLPPTIDNVEWETSLIKSVTLTPSDLTEMTTTIPSIVVYLDFPASLRPRVQVTPLTVANVTVRGPASVIAQIKDQTLDEKDRPRAILDLRREDIERGGQGTQRVRIVLPEGVSLVGDAPEVRFEVLPAAVEPQ